MSDYPCLNEMGVLHPLQIERYMVNSISNHDVLRIIYGRKKGSLLPVSRTYKFPRVQKTVTDSKGGTQTVMETDTALRTAVAELEQLLSSKADKQSRAESILEELRLLEEEVAFRSQCIKDLLARS